MCETIVGLTIERHLYQAGLLIMQRSQDYAVSTASAIVMRESGNTRWGSSKHPVTGSNHSIGRWLYQAPLQALSNVAASR